jgi:hypothetical protein
MNMRVTRRSMLSGIGAGTAALFARPLMRECFAADAGPPRRLLILYMPNTSIRTAWLPDGGRNPLTNTGDATKFTLKMGNETLEPVRPLMTVVTGLDLKNITGCNHGSAIIRLMSGGSFAGSATSGASKAVSATFDQVMATKAPLLQGTQIDSLQLGTDTRADAGSNGIQLRVMSYDGTSPLPPEIEPIKTYTRIFSSVVPAATTGDQKMAMDRAIAEQRSVLDFIKGDLDRLNARLPAAQRTKLEHHTEGLRELERALDRTGGPISLPGPPPALMVNTSVDHEKVFDQYLALVKLALQLDITRVITFMYASGNSQVSMADFLPGYAAGPLHRIAHAFKPVPLIAATRWYCDKTAKYLTELNNIKEADGSSLLDNTVVPFFSEVGQYHEHNDVPFILFGGKKFGIEGGRCLTYPGRTPSDVWPDVARIFGVDMKTFGDPQFNSGPLPELFKPV